MCPQANSLSSLVCRLLQEQETETKTFLLLLSACKVDFCGQCGLPAYGAQQEVASGRAEHEAKLGSQQHPIADYWLLHTYATVLTVW